MSNTNTEKTAFLKQHALRSISFEEALELLNVDSLFNDIKEHEDDEQPDSFYEDDPDADYIFYADSDVTINGNFKIPDVFYFGALIIVDGNLTVNGRMSGHYYVTGNTDFGSLCMEDFQVCHGQERVKYLQYQMAEDHGSLNSSPPREVNAPYFFSWFYDLNAYIFNPKTCIFALYDWDDLKDYQTNNPLFVWHEYVFAFRAEFTYRVKAFWHDGFNLKISEIYHALVKQEPIFIEGFDPACMVYFSRGRKLVEQGDIKQAFLCYKKVIELSPNFYPGYEEAGSCLDRVGAYAQAKSYLDKGIPLMPEQNRDPDFECAVGSAIHSIILGDYQAAVSLTTMAIERHPETTLAYRVRGEALLYLNELVAAETDLLKALEENPRSYRANWLLGQIYHRQNNVDQAKKFYVQAQGLNPDVKPYSETKNLLYTFEPISNVDWEDQDIDNYVPAVKGQEYWDAFFEERKSSEDPMELAKTIPEEFRTLAMLDFLVTPRVEKSSKQGTNGLCIRFFAHLEPSKELYIKAQNCDYGCGLGEIPVGLLDKEVYLNHPHLMLKDVPKDQLDYDICRHAVGCGAYSYFDLPDTFNDENMKVWAIANGLLSYSDAARISQQLKSHEYLLRAVDIGVHVLSKLPAEYVDQTLFNYAEEKYREHEGWQHLLKTHSPEHYQFDTQTFENIWACFWDEPTVLKALNAGERIYDLPEQYITQAIAEAAVRNSPNDFEYIPAEFITEELCLVACNQDDGSAIEFVPFEMRSQTLCKIAVMRECDNLVFAPLEHRTVELCKNAFATHSSCLKAIPYEWYVELFSDILAKGGDDYYKGYLILSRGIGYFYQGDLDKAIADFQSSRLDDDEINEDDLQASYYYEGWVHDEKGNSGLANECFRKSQELRDDDSELFRPYAEAELPPVVVSVWNLDKKRLDQLLKSSSELIDKKHHHQALSELALVEELLKNSSCSDLSFWAVLWDYQRYALYEIGDIQASRQLCKDCLPKLSGVTLWAYLEEHNRIRHTLRAMHNTLAYEIIENATSLDELKRGLEHSRQSLETVSPIEGSDALHPYYQGRAELLAKAAEFEPKYQKKLDQVIKKIGKLRLKDKGILSDEFVSKFKL